MKPRAEMSDFDTLLAERDAEDNLDAPESSLPSQAFLDGDELLAFAEAVRARGIEDDPLNNFVESLGVDQSQQDQQDAGEKLLQLAVEARERGYEESEPPSWDDMLRENGLGPGDSALEKRAADLVAQSRPILQREKRPMELRDWELEFGPASAPAGQVVDFISTPQCLFRGEKVMATDSATPAGSGTRIMQIAIGQRIQKPGNSGRSGAGTLTQFFAQTALANATLWDTCQPSLFITVTVSFIQACTFDMSVFGRAVF
jgi:hypothetical protein